MKRNKKITIVILIVGAICVGCLSGCSSEVARESITPEELVDTHRITSKTLNAIKGDDLSLIRFGDTKYQLKLSPNYRFASSYNEKNEITSYFVWDPKVTNQIADKKDGRVEGEYEKELEVVFENAKESAIQGMSKWNPFTSKSDKETEIAKIEKDVFVFDEDVYITPYHDDVLMYVYSGKDRNSPKEVMTNYELKASALSYYQDTIMWGIPSMRGALWDSGGCPSYDNKDIEEKIYLSDSTNGDFFTYTFTSNSGEYLTTTYGELVYPKTYYGIFFIEKNVQEGSLRHWYSFVFTNDSMGNIIDMETYDSIFEQFEDSFGVSQFYTLFDTENWAYDKSTDFSKGKSYEQLNKTFAQTSEYYLMKANKQIINDVYLGEEVLKESKTTGILDDTIVENE